MGTRRAIARKVAELDEALDRTLDRFNTMVFVTAVRMVASTVLLAILIRKFVADEIQLWVFIGLIVCVMAFWVKRFKSKKLKIFKELARKQQMVELELAILLRKDLALSRERKKATQTKA